MSPPLSPDDYGGHQGDVVPKDTSVVMTVEIKPDNSFSHLEKNDRENMKIICKDTTAKEAVVDSTLNDSFSASDKIDHVKVMCIDTTSEKEIIHITLDDTLSPLSQRDGSCSAFNSSEEVEILNEIEFLPTDEDIQFVVDLLNDEETDSVISLHECSLRNFANKSSPLLVELEDSDSSEVSECHNSIKDEANSNAGKTIEPNAPAHASSLTLSPEIGESSSNCGAGESVTDSVKDPPCVPCSITDSNGNSLESLKKYSHSISSPLLHSCHNRPQFLASLFDNIDKCNSYLFSPTMSTPVHTSSIEPILSLNEHPKSPSCKPDVSLYSLNDKMSYGMNNNLPNFSPKETRSKYLSKPVSLFEMDVCLSKKQSPNSPKFELAKPAPTFCVEGKPVKPIGVISYSCDKDKGSPAKSVTESHLCFSKSLHGLSEEELDYEWEEANPASANSEIIVDKGFPSSDSCKNVVFEEILSNECKSNLPLINNSFISSAVSLSEEVLSENESRSSVDTPSTSTELALLSGREDADETTNMGEMIPTESLSVSPCSMLDFKDSKEDLEISPKLCNNESSGTAIKCSPPREPPCLDAAQDALSDESVALRKLTPVDTSVAIVVPTESPQIIEAHNEDLPSGLKDAERVQHLISVPESVLDITDVLSNSSAVKSVLSEDCGVQETLLNNESSDETASFQKIDNLSLKSGNLLQHEIFSGKTSPPNINLFDSTETSDLKSSNPNLEIVPCKEQNNPIELLKSDVCPLSVSFPNTLEKNVCATAVKEPELLSVPFLTADQEIDPHKQNSGGVEFPENLSPYADIKKSPNLENKSCIDSSLLFTSSEPENSSKELSSSVSVPGGSAEQQSQSKLKSRHEPWVSSDAAENADNFDPKWDVLRKLETDEERYYALRKRWKSLIIPDPRKNLSVQNFRRFRLQTLNAPIPLRLGQVSCKDLSQSDGRESRKRTNSMMEDCHNDLQPPAKRLRTMSCTQVYIDKINEIQWQLGEDFKMLQAEKRQALHNLSKRQRAQFESVFHSNLPYYIKQKKLQQIHYEQTQEMQNLSCDFERRVQHTKETKQRRVELLKRAQSEVYTFNKFYHNLQNAETLNQLSITEDEAKVFEETEKMYDFYDSFYRG